MVTTTIYIHALKVRLSVLALSSRFDGHYISDLTIHQGEAFSTRSVESF